MQSKQDRAIISRALANCPDGYRFRAEYWWVDEIRDASDCKEALTGAGYGSFGPGWGWRIEAWARDVTKSIESPEAGFAYFGYAAGFATDLHGAVWAAKASVPRREAPSIFHGMGGRSDLFLKARETERVSGAETLHEAGFEDLRFAFSYRPAPPPETPANISSRG